ncbi:HSP20-like chaperone [Myxozyma melibiosi]|uniref:HSP20-like chaperone n=1 Tax=Myxozyma melibiosi TaxID=54550 RepID=A0ABR1F0C9_9ASCO
MTSIVPQVLWAQRSNASDPEKNLVYLTVNAADVPTPKIELTPTKLSYAGTDASGKNYAIEIEFFDEIDVENSKYHSTNRDSFFLLRKKEAREEFWPRLLKDKKKVHWLKTDFDKWVDEDEQEAAPTDDPSQYGGGLDFSSLGNDLGSALGGAGGMGGMPGMGGMGGMPGMGGLGGMMGGMGGMPDMSNLGGGFGDDSDDDDIPDGDDAPHAEPESEEAK